MTCKAPKNTLKGRFSGSLTIAIIKKKQYLLIGALKILLTTV